MSEALIYPFRKTKTGKNEEAKKIAARILVAVICILIFFIILELVFHFFIFPNLRIKYVDVISEIPLTTEELVLLAGIGDREYYFSVNEKTIEKRIESYPLVKKATVEKRFPETLKIVIEKRQPLALALGREGEWVVPSVFDSEGVIFQTGENVTDLNLPVISGLVFKPEIGLKLPAELAPLVQEINALKNASPELLDLISEINVRLVNDVNYELVLYPVHYRLKMFIGRSMNAVHLKYAFMVIDALDKQGIADKIDVLDFRTGEVVYKLKEE